MLVPGTVEIASKNSATDATLYQEGHFRFAAYSDRKRPVIRRTRPKRLPITIQEKARPNQRLACDCLRRAMCNAFAGDHKYASSHLAMQFLAPNLQDPVLYLIYQALCALHRMYVYMPALAHICLQAVCDHSGPPRDMRAHWPITAGRRDNSVADKESYWALEG